MTLKPFPTIEVGMIILREIEQKDINSAFQYFSDVEVVKYWGASPFTDPQHVAGMLNGMRLSFYKDEGIRWGIALKETDEMIGTIGFHNWSKSANRAEIGYELAREHWGRGILSSVMRPVLSCGFNDFGMNRIAATIRHENTASIKLIEKFGFKQEGILRDYQSVNGAYFDLLLFSLLKREYKN